jgi:alanine racemase
MRPAWVEVNLNALKKNLDNLKKCTAAGAELMTVIKADAYGHGVLKVAETYRKEGIRRFAVVMLQEGVELRIHGFNEPILIIGNTLIEDFPQLLQYNLTPTIYKYEQAVELERLASQQNIQFKIHLEVDTGMGRLGFVPGSEAMAAIQKIAQLAHIEIEGIYTHLATADRLSDQSYVNMQYEKFTGVLNELALLNIHIPIKHMSNSAATINFPKMHLDMVRPGTSLYGLYPGPEMAASPTIELFPVLSIKAKLIHIKPVPVGTRVSYSGTFEAKRASVIGVIPLGYVDGVFRQLANKGCVLLKGQRCPMVGNICMDQFMIDITDVQNPQIGDEVVILGRQLEECITADEIGGLVNTISIEVITRLGKRMPIIYVE